jgi:rhodanese-related sulfurtransferase
MTFHDPERSILQAGKIRPLPPRGFALVRGVMKTILHSLLLAFLALPLLCCAAEPPAKEKPVTVEQAEKLIADGVPILDVRTLEEWNAGHLKGAKRVTLADQGFVEQVKKDFDPKQPVLVYCRSGGRSARAAKQLRAAGYTVHDLDGGVIAWEKAGKPLVK